MGSHQLPRLQDHDVDLGCRRWPPDAPRAWADLDTIRSKSASQTWCWNDVARGRWECTDRILGDTIGLGDAYWSREMSWLVALCVCWGACVCHCRGSQQCVGRAGIWIRTCLSYHSSPHSPCKALESTVAPTPPFRLLHGIFLERHSQISTHPRQATNDTSK